LPERHALLKRHGDAIDAMAYAAKNISIDFVFQASLHAPRSMLMFSFIR
jgi:hypothetical protein